MKNELFCIFALNKIVFFFQSSSQNMKNTNCTNIIIKMFTELFNNYQVESLQWDRFVILYIVYTISLFFFMFMDSENGWMILTEHIVQHKKGYQH